MGKQSAFCYHVLKGRTFLEAFDLTFENKANIPLEQKQKAIDILLHKPKVKELLSAENRIRPKKTEYTMHDVTRALVDIAESSPLDFLAVGVDLYGRMSVDFKPVANADLRCIKSLELKKDGSIKITLYDRLDAIKSLGAIASMQNQNGNAGYQQIADSLHNLVHDVAQQIRASEQEDEQTNEDESAQPFIDTNDYSIE